MFLYKSPALISCILIYMRMNGEKFPKENVHNFSDERIASLIQDMLIVTEEPNPVDEEDFYRLACRYVLDFKAFNDYQNEQQKQYLEIYG